jgi:hypothetical protein
MSAATEQWLAANPGNEPLFQETVRDLDAAVWLFPGLGYAVPVNPGPAAPPQGPASTGAGPCDAAGPVTGLEAAS